MVASFLATAAITGFLLSTFKKYKGEKPGKLTDAVPMTHGRAAISSFLAGIAAAIGLFHYVHGILGCGDFPAPFAKLLGCGLPSVVSNIIWGLFNFFVAFILIMRCRKTIGRWGLVLLLVAGALIMSLLLRFVLLSAYYGVHPFYTF